MTEINTITIMKSFKYLAAAALTFLAVGCNKEQVTEVPDGQMVDVTFTAALPGEMATKALGDGQTTLRKPSSNSTRLPHSRT